MKGKSRVLEAGQAVVGNAFRFLAVLLENRMQSLALESETRTLLREINEEKSMIRTVFDTLPVGVGVTDGSGKVVLGNAADEKIWVGSGPGAEGQRAWWSRTGREVGPEEWAVTRAIKTGKTFLDEEIDIEYRDGTRKTILNSAAPLLDNEGNIMGAVSVNQDITERRRWEEALRASEEQFRAMFEMASIGVAQADPVTGQWIRVNRKMCEITGYSLGEMLTMRVMEVTHPEDREKGREAFERVARGGGGQLHPGEALYPEGRRNHMGEREYDADPRRGGQATPHHGGH